MPGYTAEEYEQRLLGRVLCEPTIFPDVYAVIRTEAIFSVKRHQVVYKAMCDSYFKKQCDPDSIAVAQTMPKESSDPVYLSELSILGSKNMTEIGTLAKMVLEQHLVRAVNAVSRDMQRRVAEGEEILDIAEQFNESMAEVYGQLPQTSTLDMNEVVDKTMELIDMLQSPETALITTGLTSVDASIGGFIPGNVIVVGAKRKTGKTTFALKVSFHNATTRQIPTLIFSREMTIAELGVRQAFIDAKLDFSKFIRRELLNSETKELSDALSRFRKLPIHINDTLSSITDIIFETKRMVRKKGVQLVMIDYIQLIEASASKRTDREEYIASISRALKRLAKELKIVIIVLAQLNEDNKSRESRAIEQDADKLIYLDSREDAKDMSAQAMKKLGITSSDLTAEEDADVRTIFVKIVQRFGGSGKFGDVKISVDKHYGGLIDYVPPGKLNPKSKDDPDDKKPF